MRAVRSPRRHGRSALGLGAAIAALLTGMTAGLWPPGAGDASAIAVAGPNDSWGKAIEVPGLATLNKGGNAEVNSVSCARPGICAAGGFYRDADRHRQGFVAVEKNGRWRPAIEVPGLATLNKGGNAEVNSVSCTSRGGCAAGGYYRDGEGHRQGFVAMERRGRWRQAIEVPGLATLNTGGDVGVTSVSCVSGGGCAAGGFYRDADRHRQGFVVVEKNGWWRRAIEVPGLATLNTGGNAGVASVSCASAGSCAAGGHYRDHGRQGFVVVEKNGRWRRALEVPGLGNLNKGGDAQVFSVSCGAAGSCAAGGGYTEKDYDYDQLAFVAVERHGVWGRATDVPGLRALYSGTDLSPEDYVGSVSCASAGNCAVGGDYGQPYSGGFVASENNGAWRRAVNMPDLLTRIADAYSVSCASAASCVAGGDYSDASGGVYQGWVAVERHGRWRKGTEVPGLRALNKGGGAYVGSVSCPRAGYCAAGGSYADRHGHSQGFVVSQTQ